MVSVTRLVSLNWRGEIKGGAAWRSAKSATSKMSLCKIRVIGFVPRVCMSEDENGLDTRRDRALTNYCSPFCRPAISILYVFWGEGRIFILFRFIRNFINNGERIEMRNCRFLEFIGFSLGRLYAIFLFESFFKLLLLEIGFSCY